MQPGVGNPRTARRRRHGEFLSPGAAGPARRENRSKTCGGLPPASVNRDRMTALMPRAELAFIQQIQIRPELQQEPQQRQHQIRGVRRPVHRLRHVNMDPMVRR
jgi:hypothetical protein